MSTTASANGGAVPAGFLYAGVQAFAMGAGIISLPVVVGAGAEAGLGVSKRAYAQDTLQCNFCKSNLATALLSLAPWSGCTLAFEQDSCAGWRLAACKSFLEVTPSVTNILL